MNGAIFVVREATLVSYQWPCCPKNELPESSYYSFENVRITLSTRSCSTKLVWDHNIVVGGDIFEELHAHRSVFDFRFRFFLETNGGAEVFPDNALLCVLSEVQIGRRQNSAVVHATRELAGLALIPGEEPGTWQRIGMWILMVMSTKIDAVLFDEDFSVFQLLNGVKTEDITLV
jgi:hypothetical protein